MTINPFLLALLGVNAVLETIVGKTRFVFVRKDHFSNQMYEKRIIFLEKILSIR